MIKDLKEKLTSKLKSKRGAKPLVSSNKDLKMLRKIKGRSLPGIKQISYIKKILSPREKKIIHICVWLVIVGSIFFTFSLVRKNRVQVPKVGGRYVEAVVGAPQLVNPIFSTINDVDVDLTRLIYSGLMKYDKDQRLVPDLADSYEISEDKKVYTFKLREDVVWHDGEKLTASDILFTIQSIQDPAVGSPLLVGFQGIQVDALDDYTVKFTLQEPFTPFLSSLTVGILPEHIWFNILPERMRLHKKNLEPVGSGPFMFKKLKKEDSGHIRSYELVRFGNYYSSLAFIEEFVFQFFAEYEGGEGAIQALRSKRVNGLSFIPQDLKERVERKHINLHILQLPQYTALFFNQEDQPILKQSKVRLALEHAVDKDRILREALKDEGQIIHSPILPGFPGYNPEITKAQYSTDLSNELLDESWPRISAEEYIEKRKNELKEQWEGNQTASSTTSTVNVVNEDGEQTITTLQEFIDKEIEDQVASEISDSQTFYRQNKEGDLLELDLVTINTQEYRRAAEFIAGFWQEIGIKTNIELIDTKEFSREVLKDRKYDILLYGMILGSDPDQFPFWHSSQSDFPGLNLASYVNRNVDALLEKARETDDEDEVIELYQKFQDIILAERPAIFLYMPTYTYATTDDVYGIDVVRIFHPADRLANVAEWYLETKGEWK